MRGSFEVGAVHTDVLSIHYGLIMGGQRPMKISIFAYLQLNHSHLMRIAYKRNLEVTNTAVAKTESRNSMRHFIV